MGQFVLTLLDVARALRDPLDGRYAFRAFAHRGLRRRVGSVLSRVPSARVGDHQMQRSKINAGPRRRQGYEKQGVALDLRVGDSVGLRAPVDCNRVVRGHCDDMVHSRSPHRIAGLRIGSRSADTKCGRLEPP